MSLNFLDAFEVNIDLAFTGFSKNDFKTVGDSYLDHLLNNSEFWLNELTLWIEFLRKNPDLNPPKFISEYNSFSIGLQLTDDSLISKLNFEWLQISDATDVLSFPACDEIMSLQVDKCVELGDIVVSVPTAQKQSIEHNHSLEIELRWLVSHGLLHLLGWDHPDSKKLDEMLTLQEQLLSISGNLHPIRI